MIRQLLLIFSFCLVVVNLKAQDKFEYPSLSPKGTITQVVGNTQVKIEYERPSVRKRKIFGALVPWNKVWRTGAGYCTKISFDQTVKLGGQQIDKGTYALFSIPNPDEWVIILNRDTSLYGSYDYNPELDVVRFIALPERTNRHYETLSFDIDLIPNNARIYLSWANTSISFTIETAIDKRVEQFVQEELMPGTASDSDLYAGAAEYYLYQNTNLMQGITLTDKALAIDTKNSWARLVKIRIYDRLKRYDLALQEIDKAIATTKENEDMDEENKAWEIAYLKKYAKSIQDKMKP